MSEALAGSTGHWVCTWACAPQPTDPVDLPPSPFRDGALADTTLRQTIHVSLGGERIRLRLSNAFGRTTLTVTAVTVASPAGGVAGVAAIQPGSARAVAFDGRSSVAVPAGAEAVSDPLGYAVPAGTNLTVTMHVGHEPAGVTSHPGSRTTSHLVAGDRVADPDLAGATPVDHWYFLGGLEVWAPRSSATLATLGDSLTDGRGSTVNGNDRWPDLLSARLRALPDTAGLAVVNLGIGGNQVLHGGLGPAALARLDHDVLARPCVARLIVFEGTNDIGTAAATEAAQRTVVEDLVAAYERIVSRAHARGIRVYGATLTPFGGNEAYDDPAGLRDSARSAVNTWIRTARRFDEVLDFDLATGDPRHPRRLLGTLDDGDHLHLNPAGYRAIAESIPLSLFAGSNEIPRRVRPGSRRRV
jgi:lysophospholipase L1-like esterase